ncbi:hypothetical protein JCM19000A_18730 [Silvimonas sp. JCM 19000]
MPFAAIAHHRAAQAASGLTLRGFVVSFDNAYKPVRQLAHAMSHPLRLEFARLLLNSHALLLGEPLADPALSLPDATRWLYEDAPFCLLAHNAELDPRFIYANHAAQRCFGYDWPTFFGMPSRLSAQAPQQSERQSMLAQVARDGFITDYRGLRIDAHGQRFWIEDGRLWNLLDDAGTVVGQAVAFSNWQAVAGA